MTNRDLAKQLRDLHLSVSLYIINVTEISPRDGTITVNTAYGPYTTYEAAIEGMRKRYEAALKARDLEDNGACDENEEAIPGGYFTDEEAGIYVYADFAFGQLLEVVSMTIKGINIRPDVQEYINERAEEYRAAHPDMVDHHANEYAAKINRLAEEHKALSAAHPEWIAADHKKVSEEIWKQINEEAE